MTRMTAHRPGEATLYGELIVTDPNDKWAVLLVDGETVPRVLSKQQYGLRPEVVSATTVPSIGLLTRTHWLKFGTWQQTGDSGLPFGPTFTRVIGCQCGFESDTEQTCGWGDDVVEHLMRVAQGEAK